eukprot:Opistho-2@50125
MIPRPPPRPADVPTSPRRRNDPRCLRRRRPGRRGHPQGRVHHPGERPQGDGDDPRPRHRAGVQRAQGERLRLPRRRPPADRLQLPPQAARRGRQGRQGPPGLQVVQEPVRPPPRQPLHARRLDVAQDPRLRRQVEADHRGQRRRRVRADRAAGHLPRPILLLHRLPHPPVEPGVPHVRDGPGVRPPAPRHPPRAGRAGQEGRPPQAGRRRPVLQGRGLAEARQGRVRRAPQTRPRAVPEGHPGAGRRLRQGARPVGRGLRRHRGRAGAGGRAVRAGGRDVPGLPREDRRRGRPGPAHQGEGQVGDGPRAVRGRPAAPRRPHRRGDRGRPGGAVRGRRGRAGAVRAAAPEGRAPRPRARRRRRGRDRRTPPGLGGAARVLRRPRHPGREGAGGREGSHPPPGRTPGHGGQRVGQGEDRRHPRAGPGAEGVERPRGGAGLPARGHRPRPERRPRQVPGHQHRRAGRARPDHPAPAAGRGGEPGRPDRGPMYSALI